MNYKLIILLSLVLVSCHTEKKIVYMQDATDGAIEKIGVHAGIVVQPKDVLSIVVSSKNPELAISFNLPLQTYQAGSTDLSSMYTQRILGYLVDMEGNVNFPVLGKLKVAGLTRDQLSELVRQRLIKEGLIKDPIIVTEFMNFKISVLGEVNDPGAFTVDGDRITILEALGKAGDLTIYGKRDNVLVRREKDGIVNFHRVDLRSEALLRSPVYYLQQNDVVYVEPNKTRVGQSRINENRSMSMWISLASLLTSMAVLFFR
jgi:polysaccharide export outer membrane protein